MKKDFNEAVAEVHEKLGTIEGFIVMAIDDKKQLNVLNGKCTKMLTQLAIESDEMMKLLEEAIKTAKVRVKLNALIDEAKAQGLISDEEIAEAKAEAEAQTISE